MSETFISNEQLLFTILSNSILLFISKMLLNTIAYLNSWCICLWIFTIFMIQILWFCLVYLCTYDIWWSLNKLVYFYEHLTRFDNNKFAIRLSVWMTQQIYQMERRNTTWNKSLCPVLSQNHGLLCTAGTPRHAYGLDTILGLPDFFL